MSAQLIKQDFIAKCDCKEANSVHYGEKSKKFLALKRARCGFHMVPTATNADGTCQHCGYYTYLGAANG